MRSSLLLLFFFSTSATVYLLSSPLPLFLQGPDIIIAVRWMIICLLWKLADCLSPVPEELPPPRGFSRKVPQKWLRRPLGLTKGQIERRAGEEDAARPSGEEGMEGGREGGGKNGDALILRCLFKPSRVATLASLFLRSGEWAGQQRLAEQLQAKGGIEVCGQECI